MPFSAVRDMWLILKARDEGTRALRSFARDIRMVGDTVAAANLQAAKSAAINEMAMMRLSGATVNQMLAQQHHIQNLDRQIGAMRIARAAAEEHRVAMQRLSGAMYGVSAATGAMALGVGALGVVGLIGMGNLVQSNMEYEKQVALTRTQVDKLRYSLDQIGEVGLSVAKRIAVPFDEIQPALFDIFSSMEVGLDDAAKLLEIFSKAAVAGQTSIQGASRATIGILNAFQLPLSSINHLMDVQFQLVQEGIGTYEEWVARIGLVTPSAVRFGQSVDTMAAALAVSTRMGISAARSGTAVARAMDAMSNPKAVNALKELGVNVTDAKGRFLPMIDILQQFREKLQGIPRYEDRIAKILEVFKGAGGTIEARRFLQNMLLTPGNLELFKSIFEEMANESGSFEAAYGVMADTTASKTQLLKNQWEAIKVSAGEFLIPTFEKIIGWIQKGLEWFDKLDPKTKKLIVNIIAIGSVGAVVAGGILLIVGAIAAFAAAITVAGTAIFSILGGLLAIGLAIIALGLAFKSAWDRSAQFRTMIKNAGDTVKEFWKEVVVPAAQDIKKAFDEHVRPALDKVAQVMDEKVMPVVLKLQEFLKGEFLSTAKEVGNWIKDVFVHALKFIGMVIEQFVLPMVTKLTDFYREHEGTIKQVIGWISEFVKWLLKISVVFFAVAAIIVGVVIVAIMAVIAIIVGVIVVIIKLVEWVKAVINWFKNLGDHLKSVGKLLGTVKDAIVGAFKNAKDWLIDAGKDLIRGLLEGLEKMKGAIVSKVKAIGTSIVGWFREAIGANSPAKKFIQPGKDTMRGYFLGLNSYNNKIPGIMKRVTGRLIGASVQKIPAGSDSRGEVNQNITVYTQEINPRRHAAELGWLLGGGF